MADAAESLLQEVEQMVSPETDTVTLVREVCTVGLGVASAVTAVVVRRATATAAKPLFFCNNAGLLYDISPATTRLVWSAAPVLDYAHSLKIRFSKGKALTYLPSCTSQTP